MGKFTKHNITTADWTNDATTWSEVQALAAVRAAERLELACSHLCGILTRLTRLDTLGREGLHDIIKEMAREMRAKKKRRLARRRAARRLKLVGRSAA